MLKTWIILPSPKIFKYLEDDLMSSTDYVVYSFHMQLFWITIRTLDSPSNGDS